MLLTIFIGLNVTVTIAVVISWNALGGSPQGGFVFALLNLWPSALVLLGCGVFVFVQLCVCAVALLSPRAVRSRLVLLVVISAVEMALIWHGCTSYR